MRAASKPVAINRCMKERTRSGMGSKARKAAGAGRQAARQCGWQADGGCGRWQCGWLAGVVCKQIWQRRAGQTCLVNADRSPTKKPGAHTAYTTRHQAGRQPCRRLPAAAADAGAPGTVASSLSWSSGSRLLLRPLGYTTSVPRPSGSNHTWWLRPGNRLHAVNVGYKGKQWVHKVTLGTGADSCLHQTWHAKPLPAAEVSKSASQNPADQPFRRLVANHE